MLRCSPADNQNAPHEMLYVSYVFPPLIGGGVVRAEQTCMLLPEYGWIPTVLTGRARGAPGVDRRFAEMGIEVLRARCLVPEERIRARLKGKGGRETSLRMRIAKSIARRVLVPDRQVLWQFAARRCAMGQAAKHRWKAVLASVYPISSAWAGQAIARRFNLPFLLEFRDAVRGNPASPRGFPSRGLRIARQAARAAAKIIVVNEAMKQWAVQQYDRDPGDVVVIPNGYWPDDRSLLKQLPRQRNDCFTLLHTGVFYGTRSPDVLLEAARMLIDQGRVPGDRLRIMLVGNLGVEVAAQYGMEGVVDFRPMMPHRELVNLYAQADVLVLIAHTNRHNGPDGGFMCKIYDYLMTEKPILGLLDTTSEFARFVTGSGVADVVDPDNVQDVAASIESLFRRWCRHELDAPGNVELIEQFDRRTLVGKLATVLNEAIPEREGR